MKLKNRIAAFAAAALMLTASTPTAVFAETTEVHQPAPCFSLMVNHSVSLEFTGSTAYCTTNVIADPAVYKTNIKQTLQKHWGLWIWNDVENAYWSQTVWSEANNLSRTFNVTESGTYRLEVEITITYQDGSTETETFYSGERTVTV